MPTTKKYPLGLQPIRELSTRESKLLELLESFDTKILEEHLLNNTPFQQNEIPPAVLEMKRLIAQKYLGLFDDQQNPSDAAQLALKEFASLEDVFRSLGAAVTDVLFESVPEDDMERFPPGS